MSNGRVAHCSARRQRGVRERLREVSLVNRMQQSTVCLVFRDSCGCSPGPKNPSQGRASGFGEYCHSESGGQARFDGHLARSESVQMDKLTAIERRFRPGHWLETSSLARTCSIPGRSVRAHRSRFLEEVRHPGPQRWRVKSTDVHKNLATQFVRKWVKTFAEVADNSRLPRSLSALYSFDLIERERDREPGKAIYALLCGASS